MKCEMEIAIGMEKEKDNQMMWDIVLDRTRKFEIKNAANVDDVAVGDRSDQNHCRKKMERHSAR
jgi:hypothetical protein